MNSEQCACRQAERENLVQELIEALEVMLHQFTKTPSTLKDTEARIKAHAVLKKAKGQ